MQKGAAGYSAAPVQFKFPYDSGARLASRLLLFCGMTVSVLTVWKLKTASGPSLICSPFFAAATPVPAPAPLAAPIAAPFLPR